MNEMIIASAMRESAAKLANAITPTAVDGTDATGGTVGSLTEAVMGMTAALVKIAEAVEYLAEVQAGK